MLRLWVSLRVDPPMHTQPTPWILPPTGKEIKRRSGGGGGREKKQKEIYTGNGVLEPPEYFVPISPAFHKDIKIRATGNTGKRTRNEMIFTTPDTLGHSVRFSFVGRSCFIFDGCCRADWSQSTTLMAAITTRSSRWPSSQPGKQSIDIDRKSKLKTGI